MPRTNGETKTLTEHATVTFEGIYTRPPVAELSFDFWGEFAARDHDVVTFDGSASSSPETELGVEIIRYEFDFGDGTGHVESADHQPDGAFDGKTTHVFHEIGGFTVTLRVYDSYENSGSTTVRVFVKSKPEVAASFSPSSPIAGETVTHGSMKLLLIRFPLMPSGSRCFFSPIRCTTFLNISKSFCFTVCSVYLWK